MNIRYKKLNDLAKKSDKIYLASDPDREGEAIAWHILEELHSKKKLKDKKIERVVFHEITKKAVSEAIQNPREIDKNLVDAYLVRRALDYLIGFGISPLLWRRNLGKSAGRVQSVAVKLVVDREKEIEGFKPVEYWSLESVCTAESATFHAMLNKFNGTKIEKMTIEIAPLAYMRGRTLDDSFIILDEAQNTTVDQMLMFLTRMGFGSKCVITGDPMQSDLPRGERSGLTHAISTLQKLPELGFVFCEAEHVEPKVPRSGAEPDP